MSDFLIKFFQHPALLPVLAAVLIPLLIEWLLRRRRRRIVFPAMRFLQDSDRPKKIRMQDRVLLILRMIILFLIVLALARPLIRPEDMVTVDRKDRSVILLFDATYSNGQRTGNVSSFERAKRMALEVLTGLPEGVQVAMGVVGHSFKQVQDWTGDKGLITERVEGLALTDGSGMMRDGLVWALDKIKEKSGQAKTVKKAELYIFSDMQVLTWSKGDEGAQGGRSVRGLMPQISDRAQVFVADTGGKGSANAFVTRFEPADKVLAAGVNTEFLVDVQTANLPPGQSMPMKLALFVNDEKRHFETISVPSGGKQYRVPYKILSDGEQLVKVVLEGDDSPIDNERLYLAEVPKSMKVLLLDENAALPASQRASGFWEYAIAPPSAPGREPVSAFAVKTCTWQDAQKENFSDYGVVVMSDVKDLPEGLTSRLLFYVREGGCLLVLAGQNVEPFPYEALYQQGIGPLPGMFKARQDGGGFLKSLLPDSGKLEEGTFRYFRPMALPEQQAGALKVLAQMSSGQPLALIRSYGQGKCAILGLDPGLAWSRLPLVPDFPVFVQELLRSFLGDPSKLVNLNVGMPFSVPVLVASERLLLHRPDGVKVRLAPEVAQGEDLPRLTYSDTDVRGLYELEAPPGVVPRSRFVVNLNTDEGDMTRLDEGEWVGKMGRGAVFLSPTENIAKRVESMHALREFAGLILIGVLILVLAESFLAMRFGLRKG